jgi:uncharacterized delta-60 repeat protein
MFTLSMFTSSRSRWLPALSLLVFAACSSSTERSPDPDRDPQEEPDEAAFELRVAGPKVPIVQGTTVEVAVELVRKNGFDGAVALTAASLPEGASMKPVTIASGANTITLELSAGADAAHSLPTEVELRGVAVDAEDVRGSTKLTVTVCGHPGALDTSFQGGRSIVTVGAGEDYANAMALAADGRILVAGRSAENLGDFSLIRLERDGRLDAAFGTDGKVLTPVGSSSDTAYAIAVQADGKIVLAGSTTSEDTGLDFALVRYLPDGRLDAEFGEGGKVVTSLSEDSDTAFALIVQKDGKIVAAGEASQGTSKSGLDFALVRYNADGSLDESFGDRGRVLTPIASSSGRDVVYALASQEVGGEERLIAAGGEGDFALARYTARGELDASFGEQGKVTRVNGSVIGAARSVRLAADGKILVAGHSMHDFALARFSADGELDATFGDEGRVIAPISTTNWDEAQGLAIEADGKIVIGGWTYEGNGSSGNFALARFEKDGAADETFGDGGVVVTPVGTNARNDVANAVLLASDDRIPAVRVLLAGSVNSSNHDFAVTRYWR